MKFHLFSDLHLEFAPFTLPGGEHLLLSGDIICADYLRPARTDKDANVLSTRFRKFLLECEKYKSVTMVMGNHEHYHGMFVDSINILREFVKGTNVTVLEKQHVDMGEVVLYGASLWTSMDDRNPIVMYHAKQGMNDYNLIYKEYLPASSYGKHMSRITPEDTILEHEKTIENLKEFLENFKDRKVVIMTHMAPSSRSSHPRYGVDNPLNFCYYSNLETLILDNPQIKVWVHGHTHDSHDYMIGDTRVICNPRGYANPQRPNNQENEEFNLNHLFEV